MGLSLKPLDEQVVVITGASSGIGLCTAESAAKEGAKVLGHWSFQTSLPSSILTLLGSVSASATLCVTTTSIAPLRPVTERSSSPTD